MMQILKRNIRSIRLRAGRNALLHRISPSVFGNRFARGISSRKRPGIVQRGFPSVQVKSRNTNKKTQFCYGCGATIVSGKGKVDGGKIGVETGNVSYWQSVNQRAKMLKRGNQILCVRCQNLDNGGSAEQLKRSNHDAFQRQVSLIRREENALVILAIDAIHFDGSLLRNIRELIGGNQLIIAVTRCDLLPGNIANNIDLAAHLKLTFLERANMIRPSDLFLIGIPEGDTKKADNHFGLVDLCTTLQQERRGRDVYVVGSANIGKSTLVNAMTRFFLKSTKFAEGQDYRRKKSLLNRTGATANPLLGTTLQNIPIACFEDYTELLWDTPGLVATRAQYPLKRWKELLSAYPDKIVPKVCEFPSHVRQAYVYIRRDDEQYLRFTLSLKTSRVDPKEKNTLIWFSRYDCDITVSPKLLDPSAGIIQKDKIAWKDACPLELREADGKTPIHFNSLTKTQMDIYLKHKKVWERQEQERVRIAKLGKMHRISSKIELQPDILGGTSTSGDIPILDLGWLAVHCWSPCRVDLDACIKGAAVLNVTPCLFHPLGKATLNAPLAIRKMKSRIYYHMKQVEERNISGLHRNADYGEFFDGYDDYYGIDYDDDDDSVEDVHNLHEKKIEWLEGKLYAPSHPPDWVWKESANMWWQYDSRYESLEQEEQQEEEYRRVKKKNTRTNIKQNERSKKKSQNIHVDDDDDYDYDDYDDDDDSFYDDDDDDDDDDIGFDLFQKKL